MPKKRKVIPDISEYEKTTEEVEKKLLAYIEYVQNLSPRIKIVRPILDTSFNLDDFQNQVKLSFSYSDDPNEMVIDDWPEKKDIAFIISIDSAMPGQKKEYFIKNVYVFCYGNLSFGCDRNSFIQEDNTDDDNVMHFHLEKTTGELSRWKNSIRMVRYVLNEIQKQVPPLALIEENNPA